jgi:hypothetical protein
MVIRKGSTSPPFSVRLLSANGPLPLFGATLLATLIYPSGQTRSRAMTVSNPAGGEAFFAWQAGDTDETGLMLVEIDISGGGTTERLVTPLQVEIRP